MTDTLKLTSEQYEKALEQGTRVFDAKDVCVTTPAILGHKTWLPATPTTFGRLACRHCEFPEFSHNVVTHASFREGRIGTVTQQATFDSFSMVGSTIDCFDGTTRRLAIAGGNLKQIGPHANIDLLVLAPIQLPLLLQLKEPLPQIIIEYRRILQEAPLWIELLNEAVGSCMTNEPVYQLKYAPWLTDYTRLASLPKEQLLPDYARLSSLPEELHARLPINEKLKNFLNSQLRELAKAKIATEAKNPRR